MRKVIYIDVGNMTRIDADRKLREILHGDFSTGEQSFLEIFLELLSIKF